MWALGPTYLSSNPPVPCLAWASSLSVREPSCFWCETEERHILHKRKQQFMRRGGAQGLMMGWEGVHARDSFARLSSALWEPAVFITDLGKTNWPSLVQTIHQVPWQALSRVFVIKAIQGTLQVTGVIVVSLSMCVTPLLLKANYYGMCPCSPSQQQ